MNPIDYIKEMMKQVDSMPETKDYKDDIKKDIYKIAHDKFILEIEKAWWDGRLRFRSEHHNSEDYVADKYNSKK